MSSKLIQRTVGAFLHRLREEQGWSRGYAADQLKTTADKYKKYELGAVSAVEPAMVGRWAQLLGASASVVDEIERLAYLTRAGATRWDINVDPWFGTFVALEPTASAIDIVDPEFITGLLQIPEYMESTVRVSALIAPDEGDKILTIRKNRQKDVFERDTALPQMRVLINECALLRIQREDYYEKQLAFLRDVAQLPSVELFLLPISSGLHASTSRSYMIMQFDDTPDPEVVYVESGHDAYYESSHNVISQYRKMFTATLDDAVRFERSPYGTP